MNKKDAARVLYLEGATQVEIAKILKVSENTVSKWSSVERWRDKKVSVDLLKDNSVQRIMKLIDYQTSALDKQIEVFKEDGGTQLIQRGDIDALQKLFTTIRKDSKKFTDYVSTIKEFFEFLKQHDLDLAKSLTEYADHFLNEKRKLL